jgi:hypothetical protein
VQDILYVGSDCDVTVSKSIKQPSCTVLRNDVDWPHYYSYICLLPENRLGIGFRKIYRPITVPLHYVTGPVWSRGFQEL